MRSARWRARWDMAAMIALPLCCLEAVGCIGAGGPSSVESSGSSNAPAGSRCDSDADCVQGWNDSRYGVFVLSDMHAPGSGDGRTVATAMTQMKLIDPDPIAALAAGDLTETDASTEWSDFEAQISVMFDRSAMTFDAGHPRFLSALGNHDTMDATWHARWNAALPGQRDLGSNSPDGVYFAVTHENSLFVMLDSIHESSAQTATLANTLRSSTAEFKFLFWHRPVYVCKSTGRSYGRAIPWVDLAEQNGVDAVFAGNSHEYTRTCPKYHGTCVTGGPGVTYVETGTFGSLHAYTPDIATASVSGRDAEGEPRTDAYDCQLGGGLDARLDEEANTFCHVAVGDCAATVRCYVVGANNTTPFDIWTLDHCG